jgi:hypothetical protein
MSVAASTAIGLAVAAGTATAGVVGAKMNSGAATTAAGDTSTAAVKSAQIQADAADQAANLQSQTAAQALDYSRQQSQLSLDQYNQQQQRLQPYRNLGAFALGQAPSDAPAPLTLPNISVGSTTAPTSGATTPASSPSTTTSGAGSANYQPLLSALNQGQNPQAVIAQFNTAQGLPNGSSYAWRSIPTAPGGGVVEVPGGAYLAPGPNGSWGYTPGSSSSSGSSSATPAAPGPVTLNYTPTNISSGNAYTPTAGTLNAPVIQPYRTLSQVGGIQ